MAHLYEVSLLPSEMQVPVLSKIADEGLTRDQLLALTTEIKEKAGPAKAARGGRPTKKKVFTQTITLPNAIITIRFRTTHATAKDVTEALHQAIKTLA
jgi:hypothetical protein